MMEGFEVGVPAIHRPLIRLRHHVNLVQHVQGGQLPQHHLSDDHMPHLELYSGRILICPVPGEKTKTHQQD
jgi:hypothetical protein